MKKLVEVDVRPPGLVGPVVWTTLLLLAVAIGQVALHTVIHQTAAQHVADQLKGDAQAYEVARAVHSIDTAFWVTILTILGLVAIWGRYVAKLRSYWQLSAAPESKPSEGTPSS